MDDYDANCVKDLTNDGFVANRGHQRMVMVAYEAVVMMIMNRRRVA